MYLPVGQVGTFGPSRQAVAGTNVSNVPYRGAAHTVEMIHRGVNLTRRDPGMRAVVEDVTRSLYAKDYLSEAAAIYYAVCRGVRYLRDPSTVELVKDPSVILKTRVEDCDGMSTLLAGLLGQAGIGSVEYTTVGFHPNQLTHVFVTFPDPRGSGRRVVVDPVAGPTTATMLKRVVNMRAFPGF